MNYTKNTLRQLGLAEGEIEVYLTGLTLGSTLASNIANKTKLGRTLVYHLIDRLEKRGLVSKARGRYGYQYSMEAPGALLKLIENKEAELKKIQKKLARVIPSLESISTEELGHAKIKFYEGLEGMKNAVNNTLTAQNKDVYSFMPGLNIIEKTFGKQYLRSYIKKRKKNGIQAKNIWSKPPDPQNPLSQQVSKNIRVAPDLNFDSSIVLHDDNVTVLSSAKYMSAFVIQNKEFADSMRSLFNKIWKHSKSAN